MCVMARGLKSEENFREIFLSCLPVGSGDGTQDARLTPKPALPAVPSDQPKSSAFISKLCWHFHFHSISNDSMGQADRLI